MRRYSEEHQWVEVSRGAATVGITAYAAEELGELTFVELPAVGTSVTQGENLCVVESVKAASDVFAPVSGTVSEVNQALDANPALVNASPERDGWICRLKEVEAAEMEGMMTEEEYEAFIASEDEDDDETKT
jgi:glycine cleavage system H protein